MKNTMEKPTIEKLLNPNIRNYRDIDLKAECLIVLGWDNGDDGHYVTMGEYQCGHMHNSVYLKDTLELANSNCTLEREERADVETAEWWRTPTDEEVRYYHSIYKAREFEKEMDYIIDNIKEDWFDKDDICDRLEEIKQLIRKELNKNVKRK